MLSPSPISPIAAPSKEQKKHDDNKNKIHIFLQNIWREISLVHMWAQNDPLTSLGFYLLLLTSIR